MTTPLIHIGYHKAGSSWLQECLFNNQSAGFVMPFERYEEISRLLIYPNALSFDAAACREHFQPKIEATIAQDIIPVVSGERLSGNPHSGGYDCKELADRLQAVFPGSRVLIIIREQKSMILSSYKQYVRSGGTASFRDYVDPPFYRKRHGLRIPLFRFDYFEYHWLIEYYKTLFGDENVLTLLFESFCKEPKEFTSEILNFAGSQNEDVLNELSYSQRVNYALSPATVVMKRRLNIIAAQDSVNPWVMTRRARVKRMVDSTIQTFDKLVPAGMQKSLDAKLKKEVEKIVGSRYAESNRRVAEITGADLQKYGYDV